MDYKTIIHRAKWYNQNEVGIKHLVFVLELMGVITVICDRLGFKAAI